MKRRSATRITGRGNCTALDTPRRFSARCGSRRSTPVPLLCAGAYAFAAGLGLRVGAIFTLGRFYSHSVRTVEGHRIVDGGPYRVVRHPAYAGVVAFFFSVPALAVYLAWLVPAIVLRILVEERTLMGLDGYREFASSRKRIIPGIW
ncbi:MAG: isoprenylcysteine carboxylmethyltransferase family protein [Spirochaetes bacterium]|nr:MAG: isoprenylcysteine carboxylmethyltransferase family protein [Spirochaetota bacterium]